jgi:hypothetical protein
MHFRSRKKYKRIRNTDGSKSPGPHSHPINAVPKQGIHFKYKPEKTIRPQINGIVSEDSKQPISIIY